jgi:PAS domain S-box-containing protein
MCPPRLNGAMSSLVDRLARQLRVAFNDDPASLRVLSLALYTVVGPVFTVVLALTAHHDVVVPATLAVGGLIVLGAGLLVALRRLSNPAWVIVAGIVPVLSCAIAYRATGDDGTAYVAVILAPVAWAAVLLELPVVVATVAIALVAAVAVIPAPGGLHETVLNAAVYGTIVSLVGLVGYRKSAALRHARAEAAAGAARLRALFEAIPDTVARATPEGRFLEVHGADPSLPMAAEALVGRLVFEFLPPEVHAPMRTALERANASGEPQVVRYTLPRADKPRSVEARIVRAAPGELVVIRQDITERERNAREHEYLAVLVGAMRDAVITIDVGGRITTWSPGAERLYGWAADEALGRPLRELLAPDTSEEAYAAFMARLFEEGQSIRTVTRRRRDGTTLDAEIAFTALFDEAGQPLAMLGVTRDRSAARAEHARELDEARLRGLVERMNEIELVSGADGRIVHANDRAAEAYGWAAQELVGMPIADLRVRDASVAGEGRADIAEAGVDPETEWRTAAARHGDPDEHGTRVRDVHRRRDGSTFPVEVSSRGFEVGGRRYLHSLVRDLTQQRRMEADQKRMLDELMEALTKVRTLSGLLPICMYCKKIRNDQGYWDRIEKYVSEHSDAQFSHGMCPDCYARYAEPELALMERDEEKDRLAQLERLEQQTSPAVRRPD